MYLILLSLLPFIKSERTIFDIEDEMCIRFHNQKGLKNRIVVHPIEKNPDFFVTMQPWHVNNKDYVPLEIIEFKNVEVAEYFEDETERQVTDVCIYNLLRYTQSFEIVQVYGEEKELIKRGVTSEQLQDYDFMLGKMKETVDNIIKLDRKIIYQEGSSFSGALCSSTVITLLLFMLSSAVTAKFFQTFLKKKKII